MEKTMSVYRCLKCGNIVEMLHDTGVPISCCGEPMKKLTENSVEASTEKHVPFIEKIQGGWKVSVGSVAHPMEEKHYIQWIELIADGKSCIARLKPGDKPEAVFMTDAKHVIAREYCNLHGFWKAEA